MRTTIPIVAKKLCAPIFRGPSKGRILQRQRLLDVLDAVTTYKLTLVCAGPGYGKTTLLSALSSFPVPVVWYSLGPTDRDLTVFVSYLVEGLRRHRAGFGDRILQRLSVKHEEMVNPLHVAAEIVNGLGEAADQKMVIVLENYHYVDRYEPIRTAVDFLVAHLPANVHLVISTRQLPSLPCLARLRMIGEVNAITEADLRLTPDEAQHLLVQVYDLDLSAEAVDSMVRQADGWIIALHLAGQSLKARVGEDHADFLASMDASKRLLFEYLAEEVFRRESTEVQQFLTESSILSTLSVENCDAILGRADTSTMLDHIERNNLFAVEMGEGNWRYHHLFRDFLRQLAGRDPLRFQELHRRAGDYYEVCGSHEAAVPHYLAGADYARAAAIISRVGQAMLTSSRFDTLTYWIGQMPESELLKAPEVLLLQADVFRQQGHYERCLQWLERAGQAFVAKGDDIGLVKVLSGKVFVSAYRSGRHPEAQVLYRQALDCLKVEDRVERADLLASVCLSYQEDGNPSAALEAYEEAVRVYEEAGDKGRILGLLLNPGTWLRRMQGDFEQGYAELQRAFAIAEEFGSKHRLAECLSGMSVMLRHLDRCDEAKDYASRAVALSREVGSAQLEAASLVCLGVASQGGRSPDLEAARGYAREAARLGESEGFVRAAIWAQIVEVGILRRMNDLAGARRIGERLLAIAERTAGQSFKANARMGVAAALIGQDDARAGGLLLAAREGFLRLGDKFGLACANFWLAVLHQRSSPSHALEYFQASLELARAQRYDFWFREESATAVPLLKLAIESGIYPEYCAHLIESMEPEARDGQRGSGDGQDGATSQTSPQRLPPLAVCSATATSLDTSERQVVLPTETVGGSASASGVHGVPLLRVYCFGSFRVYLGERLLRGSEWQRKRAKRLVEYLAATVGHTAARDELIEVFWGDLQRDAALLSLRQALHNARRALEPNLRVGKSEYILSNQDCLSLNLDLIDVIDVDVFRARVTAAQRAERLGDLHAAAQEYQGALEVYTADFLADDPWEDWAVPKRERFRNLHIDILHKLANWRIKGEDNEGAITYLLRLLDLDRTREDIHALLIKCFAKTGRRQEAFAQYRICCTALRQDLDQEPGHEIRELRAKLDAGDDLQ